MKWAVIIYTAILMCMVPVRADAIDYERAVVVCDHVNVKYIGHGWRKAKCSAFTDIAAAEYRGRPIVNVIVCHKVRVRPTGEGHEWARCRS